MYLIHGYFFKEIILCNNNYFNFQHKFKFASYDIWESHIEILLWKNNNFDMRGAECFESVRCKIGVAFSQGANCTMQDRYSVELDKVFCSPGPVDYTAVIGGVGHDGDTASLFVASNLNEMVREELLRGKSFLRAVEDACIDLDEKLLSTAVSIDRSGKIFNDSGATICAMWIQGGKIFCANVGDCRVIVSHNKSALPITKDHVPDDPTEKCRIEHAGCRVYCNKIDNFINVSRAFGLFSYKQQVCPKMQQAIVPMPNVYEVDMDPRIDFFILASGSVWEVMSNDQAISYVENRLRDQLSLADAAQGLVDWCETLWRNTNCQLAGTGNLTCAILTLHPCAYPCSPCVPCPPCRPSHVHVPSCHHGPSCHPHGPSCHPHGPSCFPHVPSCHTHSHSCHTNVSCHPHVSCHTHPRCSSGSRLTNATCHSHGPDHCHNTGNRCTRGTTNISRKL